MKRIFALILLLSLLLTACAQEAPVYPVPELIEPVQPQPKTVTVQRADLVEVSTLLGSVNVATVPVAFPVGGTLETLYVTPGQSVHKGDVIAVLNTESLQKQLDNLLEQQERTNFNNSLNNRNQELNIQISKLRLEDLVKQQEEALAKQAELLTQLQDTLTQLQLTNAEALAALEQELQQLQQQLEAVPSPADDAPAQPDTPTEQPETDPTQPADPDVPATEPEDTPTDPEQLQAQIAQLQEQIAQLILANAESEAQAEAAVQEQQKQVEALAQQQALQKELSQLDVRNAELTLAHAKQTQELNTKQTNTIIALLRSQLEKTVVTAPIDGTVTWISSSKKVSADKAVVYIADEGHYFVRTEEANEVKLQNAERIYALIGSREYDLTYRPIPVEEKIAMSMKGVPAATFYDFEADAAIPTGNNALVYCIHRTRLDVLSVPKQALNLDSNGYFVYKMNNGQKEQVYITVGMISPLRAEILSGLEEGDVVYVAD